MEPLATAPITGRIALSGPVFASWVVVVVLVVLVAAAAGVSVDVELVWPALDEPVPLVADEVVGVDGVVLCVDEPADGVAVSVVLVVLGVVDVDVEGLDLSLLTGFSMALELF
ncbi:hypothetical protein IPL85_02065 [Candidatus Saccharibacteria bacterium]|nr:MAG: hypothetical protein IPL85_02065 [Candidatus Saccharibacteria bacterium]